MENNQVTNQNSNVQKKVQQPKAKVPKQPIDKQDIICYVGAAVFFILALVPHLLRIFDPNYPDRPVNQNKVEEKQVKKILVCTKTIPQAGFTYTVDISSNYTNGNIQTSNFKYTINLDETGGLILEDVVIDEYESIAAIQSNAIKLDESNNIYTIDVDYKSDTGLRNNDILKNHSQNINQQPTKYQESGYQCNIVEG